MPDLSLSPIYGLLVDKNSGEVFDLMPGDTSIGRSNKNDISFASDLVVSRHHAVVTFADGDFYLDDIGSRNGTLLNGKLLEGATKLSSGDEILIGCRSLVALLASDIASLLENLPGATKGIYNLDNPALVLKMFRRWGHLAVGIVSKLKQKPRKIPLPKQRESTEFIRTMPLPDNSLSFKPESRVKNWTGFNRPF